MSQISPPRDVSALYAGRDVVICSGKATARVFPVGVRHLEQYAVQIASLVVALEPYLKNIELDDTGRIKIESLRGLVPTTINALVSTHVDLLQATCDIDVRSLSHWDLAKVADAWTTENILEEDRLNPWMRVLEATWAKVSGSSLQISEILSKRSSQMDTVSSTSSTLANPDARTTAGASDKLPSIVEGVPESKS